MLTAKFEENESKSINVSVDSFAKVVPDCDGISIPIRQWLENFGEIAEAYQLTERQKYVNARNKMTGTAKLLSETITVANYEDLCMALIDEFDVQLSSAELHKRLRSRKKLQSENFQEYVLQMRKIGALGNIEDESIINYIVDGLQVRDDLKYPLYSSTSFKELKKCHDRIDAMTKNSQNKRRQVADASVHDKANL